VTGIHLIVLPGGGYSQHVAHEGEPIVGWLNGLSVRASVFRYPLQVRHPEPLNALRTEIRRLRDDGAERIGLIGFSAGGHLAGLAALAPGDLSEAVDFAELGPPFFMWHTAEDAHVPPEHTYRLARSLAANGVPHTVHVFAHGPTASAWRRTAATRRPGRRSRRPGSLNRTRFDRYCERRPPGS
jgi:dienelactone hydrolase